MVSIGKNIVYIEGRNGNSPAKYQQEETLTRAFSLLDQQGICIKRFRADSASCQQKVISLVQGTSQHFYIRAVRCATMEQQISQIRADAWQKVRLGVQEMEVTQLADYRPFDGKKSYRLVVVGLNAEMVRPDYSLEMPSRIELSSPMMSNGTTSKLSLFITKRGNAERTFDTMNNDFGWSKLPCSFLNENTAFMIITALYANIYQVMLATFARKLSWIKENFRLKKFIFRFISVAAKRIKTGRQHVLKLYSRSLKTHFQWSLYSTLMESG